MADMDDEEVQVVKKGGAPEEKQKLGPNVSPWEAHSHLGSLHARSPGARRACCIG